MKYILVCPWLFFQIPQILPDDAQIMPSLLELEEAGEVFQEEDSPQDDHHGVKDDKSRRFLASYIGCCDLQSGYTPTHLNYAIGQLADVRNHDLVTLSKTC